MANFYSESLFKDTHTATGGNLASYTHSAKPSGLCIAGNLPDGTQCSSIVVGGAGFLESGDSFGPESGESVLVEPAVVSSVSSQKTLFLAEIRDIMERSSNFARLRRVVAYFLRFIYRILGN